jgi:hypothetical protein
MLYLMPTVLLLLLLLLLPACTTELLADCKQCCVKDESNIKYTTATLEVCPYRLK